jgi:hypothetical protein
MQNKGVGADTFLGTTNHENRRQIFLVSGEVNRFGFTADSRFCEDGAMSRATRYSHQVRERAVRMVLKNQHGYSPGWATLASRYTTSGWNVRGES